MAKLMRQSQRAQGAHCVDKQRVRPVEGVNVSLALAGLCPASGLNSSGDFQRQLVKIVLLLVPAEFSFAHQPPQVSVRGNIIEAMVMNAGMG